jgi:protein SCO1/2
MSASSPATVPPWARTVLALALLATLGAVVAISFARDGAGPELPDEGPAPAFELTDQDGKPFSSRSLAGKVTVAHFMFSRCQNTCPGQMEKILAVEKAVRAEPDLRGRVRLLSISVDGERDGPADLKAFGERLGADPAISVFLTGRPDDVAGLSVKGFQFSASSDLVHSDRFTLVDAAGRIRGRYRPAAEAGDLERLVRDVKRLAARARP